MNFNTFEDAAVYLLSPKQKILKKTFLNLLEQANASPCYKTMGTDLYEIDEYVTERGLIRKEAFCTCLQFYGTNENHAYTKGFITDMLSFLNGTECYFDIRPLTMDDAFRLGMFNDITFACFRRF